MGTRLRRPRVGTRQGRLTAAAAAARGRQAEGALAPGPHPAPASYLGEACTTSVTWVHPRRQRAVQVGTAAAAAAAAQAAAGAGGAPGGAAAVLDKRIEQLGIRRRDEGQAVRCVQHHHQQHRGTPVHPCRRAVAVAAGLGGPAQVGRQAVGVGLAPPHKEAGAGEGGRLIGVDKEEHVVGLVSAQARHGRRALAELQWKDEAGARTVGAAAQPHLLPPCTLLGPCTHQDLVCGLPLVLRPQRAPRARWAAAPACCRSPARPSRRRRHCGRWRRWPDGPAQPPAAAPRSEWRHTPRRHPPLARGADRVPARDWLLPAAYRAPLPPPLPLPLPAGCCTGWLLRSDLSALVRARMRVETSCSGWDSRKALAAARQLTGLSPAAKTVITECWQCRRGLRERSAALQGGGRDCVAVFCQLTKVGGLRRSKRPGCTCMDCCTLPSIHQATPSAAGAPTHHKRCGKRLSAHRSAPSS